jgi:DNA-directed RNA polymerase II subunit RPB2
MYATNWQNRFDNNAHILCYGQAPLTRTIYQDYFGEGRLPYGQNITLALCCYTGYNQEDGIVMNKDALQFHESMGRDYYLKYIKTKIEDVGFLCLSEYTMKDMNKCFIELRSRKLNGLDKKI